MSRLSPQLPVREPDAAGLLVLGQHREQDPPGYSSDDVVTVDQHRPVEKLPVSQDDKEKIAHLNAEKLFSL
jgi:hypothetical protein